MNSYNLYNLNFNGWLICTFWQADGYKPANYSPPNTVHIKQYMYNLTFDSEWLHVFFWQANGYKPAPLDLSAIELTPKMEELVSVLFCIFLA